MAKETRSRLTSSALELLSRRWYQTVSVAEICRNAGVSNGIFYRYFSTKDEIFATLLDGFLERFSEDLERVDGETPDQRIANFVDAVAGAARRYAGEVTVFREGQYLLPEYERRLHALYQNVLVRLYGRAVTPVEYLYLLAGVRFIATRSLYHDLLIDTDLITRMLLTGVFPHEGGTLELPEAEHPAPVERQEPHGRLLEAGLELFGERGVHLVQVVDVARRAGYSVGTFYNHFESKEQFLSTVVLEIGRRTRAYLRSRQRTELPRWEQEILGIADFLDFFSPHPNYYQIVREAEFVVPQTVKAYYDAFERGYREGLTGFPERQRPTVANFLMGLAHYAGIEVLLQRTVVDRRAFLSQLGGFLRNGIPR